MFSTVNRGLLTLSTCVFSTLVLLPSFAQAQLPESTVVFSEFFEEVFRFDSSNPSSLTDILDSPPGPAPSGSNIEVLNPNTIALTSGSELYLYDVNSQSTSLLTDLSFNPFEITRDVGGGLIAVGTEGVIRIDTATGAETEVFEQMFFGADDAVVDDQGNIFVTEFFESVGVVSPTGGFTPIGDFGSNRFSHLDIGIDGALYLSSSFGGDFYRIDQSTGLSTLLAEDAFTSIRDLQVSDDGNILFGGVVDATNGIFSFDLNSGAITTVIDQNNVDGLFNVQDLDIYSSVNRSALGTVPEPSSAGLIAILGLAASLRRRRNV